MHTNTINLSNLNQQSFEKECSNCIRSSLAFDGDDGTKARIIDHWVEVAPQHQHVFKDKDILKKLEKFYITEVYENEFYDDGTGTKRFALTQFREVASVDFDLMLIELVHEVEMLNAEYDYWSCYLLNENGDPVESVHL